MINIKNIFNRTSTDGQEELNIIIEYTKKDLRNFLNYGNAMDAVKEIIVSKIVAEMYPDVRDKALSDESFPKIINEIRLLVAKKFIEDK